MPAIGGLTEEDIIFELNSITDTMASDSDEGGDSEYSDADDFHTINVSTYSNTSSLVGRQFFRLKINENIHDIASNSKG